MPIESDLVINKAAFDASKASQKTKDMNEHLIKIMEGIPPWYQVCHIPDYLYRQRHGASRSFAFRAHVCVATHNLPRLALPATVRCVPTVRHHYPNQRCSRKEERHQSRREIADVRFQLG